jgi:uncharacterized membrane protein YecN with MAPEG domain
LLAVAAVANLLYKYHQIPDRKDSYWSQNLPRKKNIYLNFSERLPVQLVYYKKFSVNGLDQWLPHIVREETVM